MNIKISKWASNIAIDNGVSVQDVVNAFQEANGMLNDPFKTMCFIENEIGGNRYWKIQW